jgi:hypothetical protein
MHDRLFPEREVNIGETKVVLKLYCNLIKKAKYNICKFTFIFIFDNKKFLIKLIINQMKGISYINNMLDGV